MIRILSVHHERHPLLTVDVAVAWDRLPAPGQEFLYGCGDATGAVIAYSSERDQHDHAGRRPSMVVGFFRWWQEFGWETIAAGTWVDYRFRRHGLARRLWDRALLEIRGPVEVSTVSPGGAALVAQLVRDYGPRRIRHV